MSSVSVLRIATALFVLMALTGGLFADNQSGNAIPSGEVVAEVKPQDIYSGLVAETVRGLLEEVLILGLFVVGIGHFTHATRDPTYLWSTAFRRRIVLLAAVMLFVTYMKLTYSVEWALGLEGVIQEARIAFTDHDRHLAALMLVVLTPIDLLIVVLLAAMFLALARDEYLSAKDEDALALITDLKQLYQLTGGTHVVTILWWLIFAVSTDGIFSRLYDIGYHLFFVALHTMGYLALMSSASESLNSPTKRIRLETIHVAWYSFITIAVYVSRLWIYVFRYTTG